DLYGLFPTLDTGRKRGMGGSRESKGKCDDQESDESDGFGHVPPLNDPQPRGTLRKELLYTTPAAHAKGPGMPDASRITCVLRSIARPARSSRRCRGPSPLRRQIPIARRFPRSRNSRLLRSCTCVVIQRERKPGEAVYPVLHQGVSRCRRSTLGS